MNNLLLVLLFSYHIHNIKKIIKIPTKNYNNIKKNMLKLKSKPI